MIRYSMLLRGFEVTPAIIMGQHNNVLQDVLLSVFSMVCVAKYFLGRSIFTFELV